MKFKDYSDKTVRIKNTTFYIQKMNADKGWEVFEKLRVALADKAAEMESVGFEKDFIKLFSCLPIDFVLSLRQELFSHVYFTNQEAKDRLELSEEFIPMAFKELEPIHIYELLFRCLAVNFFSSFQIIKEKFPPGIAPTEH